MVSWDGVNSEIRSKRMCGICGVVNFASGAPVSAAIVDRMNEAIHHRGPDDVHGSGNP